MLNAAHTKVRSTATAVARVDARALVLVALVSLISGLVLILKPGAAWLHVT